MQESDGESPIIVFHFLFGTLNNYTWARFKQHVETIDHCYKYIRW
jgi:hypothetical protein